VVITTAAAGPRIRDRLKARFNAEVVTHYSFVDRERGYILAKGQDGSEVQVPLMTLSVGLVTSETRPFSDIREITEMAADARRQDAVEALRRGSSEYKSNVFFGGQGCWALFNDKIHEAQPSPGGDSFCVWVESEFSANVDEVTRQPIALNGRRLSHQRFGLARIDVNAQK